MARTEAEITPEERLIFNEILPLGAAGQVLTVNAGATALEYTTPAGMGDMLASVYDPAGVATQVAFRNDITQNTKQNLELALTPNYDAINGAIVLDSSKNHFHGTVSGATYVPNGGLNNGGVYDFDGVDDYIELNDGMLIKTFDVTTKEGTPRAIYWKPDGLSFFVIGNVNREVHKWNCSTAWNSDTATFSQSSTVVFARESDPNGLSFSADGTKMYVLGNTGGDITYFTLTAWDLSTLAYVSEFSVSGQVVDPRGMFYKPDGTGFYVVGDNPNRFVYQYTIGTPWDMSTASYATKSFDVLAQESFPQGLSFKSDGTRMYVAGLSGDDITEYTVGTPWDVTTCTATGITFYIGGQNTDPTDMFFSPDGTKVFIVGVTPTSRMYTYNLYSAYSFSNPMYSNGFTIIADIKTDGNGELNGGRIFDKTKSATYETGFIFTISTFERIAINVNAGTTIFSPNNPATDGVIGRAAVSVNSSGDVVIYVNGVSVATGTTGLPSAITVPANARIGNRAGATDRTFDGYIGPVRIISRVLTATEVANDYLQRVEIDNPPETPRLTTAMRNLMSPSLGQKVYNTTTDKDQGYNGTWNDLY